jgi:hypothetical protein
VKTPNEGCVGPAGDIVNVLGLVADTITEPPLTVGQVVANTIAGLNELPVLELTLKFNVAIESQPAALRVVYVYTPLLVIF